MPLQFSQNFHQLLWGSQNDGSSQDAQSQNELYRSQNETSWQNDSQLSQSLLGNGSNQSKTEMPLNRTFEPSCLNANKRDFGGSLSQMPLASVSNGNTFLSRLKAEDRTSSSKYTIPNWARGVRGANNAGNTSYSQTQAFSQANAGLQNSIQAKRMEAQQRDVKDYLMNLINSMDQIKKAFMLGQIESSTYMEQFVTTIMNSKAEEINKYSSENIDIKFKNQNESLKKFLAEEYSEGMKILSDKTDLLKKYCKDESEKTQQLHQAVSETMNMLGQMQNQVSCFFEVLETLREEKIQNSMGQNDLNIKNNAQFNALRLDIGKMKSEVETLLDGQMVIREDLADNKEKSSMSFKDIRDFFCKILGSNSQEPIKTSMIRSRREIDGLRDAAEISTRLDSQFNNTKESIPGNRKDSVCYSISNSKNLNRSYKLWEVASVNAPNKIQNSSLKPQGGSNSILPSIHTSTPKIVGVVKPIISITTSKQDVNETRKSSVFSKPFAVPTSNKRAMLKKQRFLRDRPINYHNDEIMNQNVKQNEAGTSKNDMRYMLRSTANLHKHLKKNNENENCKVKLVSNNQDNEPKSDDSDDMFS